MSLLLKLRTMLGPMDYDKEYWVHVSDIRVQPSFRKTKIREEKWRAKKDYYLKTGELQSPILLRRKDWTLIDGYSSFRLAEEFHLGKVPVYFVG